MNIQLFTDRFEQAFPKEKISAVTKIYEFKPLRRLFDPCPTVVGMSSIKKLKLLNMAYSCLQDDECYFEVGTYIGKSLICAMLDNAPRATYACDNFSQFNDTSSEKILLSNLDRYGLKDRVTFFNCDYAGIMDRSFIREPVGVYLNDGAHDFESQYLGIKLAEKLLADEALIIVDDWRLADDSASFAKAGTMKAVEESSHTYELLYELPARFNGDHAMWWNGVGVLSFNRRS